MRMNHQDSSSASAMAIPADSHVQSHRMTNKLLDRPESQSRPNRATNRSG
jgi:hypothetical protein